MEQYLRLHAGPRRKQLLFNERWCQYWRIRTPADSWTICWCTSKLQWREKPYSTHTWISTQTTWWGTVKYKRLVSITWGLRVVMKLTFPKIVIFFSIVWIISASCRQQNAMIFHFIFSMEKKCLFLLHESYLLEVKLHH